MLQVFVMLIFFRSDSHRCNESW